MEPIQNTQATTQTVPPQPVVQKTVPAKPKDPVQQLIDIQKENQELLKVTAANSELLLEAVKSQGKYKIYGAIAKYAFYGILAFWSLAMMPKLIQTITNQMLGGMGGQISGSGAVDPDNIQNILEGLDLNAILGN